MILRKKILLLLLIAMFSLPITGQKTLLLDGLVFEHYDESLNLSSNKINDFFEDSNNIIWVSTFDGLNAFDGNNFKNYKEYFNEGNNFRGSYIRKVIEDSAGNIFCLTNRFVNFLPQKTDKFDFINVDNFGKRRYQPFLDLVEFKKGEYLVVSTKFIYHLKKDNNHQFSLIEKKPRKKNNNVFFKQFLKTKLHILSVYKNHIQILNDADSRIDIKDEIKECIFKNDRIWVLTTSKIGVLDMESKNINWIPVGMHYKDDQFNNFDIDKNNTIWIGSAKNLINVTLNHELEVQNIKYINIGKKNKIYQIYVDSKDNLYLESAWFGLLKLDANQKKYTYVNLPSNFKDGYLSKFLVDKNGHYWFGGINGVHIYNPIKKEFKKFKNNTYTICKGKRITSIISDKKDNIWIGTFNGVYYYNFNTQSLSEHGKDKDLPSTFSHHLNIDAKNNLWYGTHKGVITINSETKKTKFYPSGSNTTIYIDDLQRLWVSINNYGLAAADITQDPPKQVYAQTEKFSNYNFHYISSVKDNKLWLAGNNGIIVYDTVSKKIIKHFNRSNILNRDFYFDIVKDKNENFWVAQNGKSNIHINSTTYEIDGYSPSWMKTFSKKGQQYSSINNADKSGKIFAATYNGFWVYNPDDIIPDKTPQKVVLTELKIKNKVVFDNFLGNQNISLDTLQYFKNDIQVKLKTINYKPTFTTNYAYRLKGITAEWEYTKSINELNFNTLTPNNYTLEVKETNDGKNWSLPTTLLSFTIHPPYWKSNLAYFIYVLIISAIIYGFYRLLLHKKIAQKESQKLKEVDEFKNKFYENITHEFRTPLTVILGVSNKLEGEYPKTIERNAKQLLKLVNELLSIGKIEANKTKLFYADVNMIRFVKYCMESLESLAKEKRISMYFTANKNEILSRTDKDKLQLVLNNLISNAIKFTPKNGVIQLEVTVIDKTIAINVKDNGIGIPKNSLNKIFDRFYQVTNKESSNSSGIGLALSREIIKLMDGNLVAKNNNDKGCTFTITLPILEQRNLENEGKINDELIKPDKDFNNQENVILVIEDNKDVLFYIKSILSENYNIICANNGKEGYEKAISFIPDLIISDVMMPVLNGFEAAKLIKEDFKTNHIPIILLTAKADLDSKLTGLDIGADAYLEKPFHQNQLLAQIKNLISEREKLKFKYQKSLNNPSPSPINPKNPFIDKLENLIIDNLDNTNFSIEFVCEELGVSRTQLHRKLKGTLGLSTSIYIREVRLIQGYKLLRENKQYTVAEVAYKVGFNDPNYFTKLFTEKYKLPPSKVN